MCNKKGDTQDWLRRCLSKACSLMFMGFDVAVTGRNHATNGWEVTIKQVTWHDCYITLQNQSSSICYNIIRILRLPGHAPNLSCQWYGEQCSKHSGPPLKNSLCTFTWWSDNSHYFDIDVYIANIYLVYLSMCSHVVLLKEYMRILTEKTRTGQQGNGL